MGNIGWTGIIIVAILVVLLFGRGKISSIMGDVAKGIKSFKKGMSDDNKGMSDDNKGMSDDNKGMSDGTDQSEKILSEKTSNEDSNSEKN